MAAPNFTPSLMELSSQCDKAVSNKTASTVATVHRPATPRKRQLSNESSIFTDMSGAKKITVTIMIRLCYLLLTCRLRY
jgi:hypothetical protein